MYVTNKVELNRPFIVCAILRNLKLTKRIYERFLELQERLHYNICRKRSLVAIGIHDLDLISPNFIYDAQNPEKIYFNALNEKKSLIAKQLFNFYNNSLTNCHIKEYLPLLEKKSLYPIIFDRKGKIISIPPIINSEYSKLTKKKRIYLLNVRLLI